MQWRLTFPSCVRWVGENKVKANRHYSKSADRFITDESIGTRLYTLSLYFPVATEFRKPFYSIESIIFALQIKEYGESKSGPGSNDLYR